jgi:phosphoglycolate phosphatase
LETPEGKATLADLFDFIGDETSDVKAANQARLANIAVSWGFNNREVLLKAVPDALVDHPTQLVLAIAQLSNINRIG